MAREKGIVEAIIRELRARGAWWVKYHGHRAGKSGVPDILACYRGLFLAIEVKQPGGKQTRLQELEQTKIRQAGGISIVATSRQEASEALDQIDADLIAA
jgi:Holliday junction resolvase